MKPLTNYDRLESGEPTHLDLFSGIGGFALAAKWAGFRTIGFCEIDKFCQRVLAKNFLAHPFNNGLHHSEKNATKPSGDGQNNGIFKRGHPARIFPDIFALNGKQFAGVDLITGGFPCQPFSHAGKRGGKEDNRHLWPEMLRVVSEARPAWVLGENVTGIISMELDNVLSDLEGIGYSCRTFIIPACGVDAKHRRNRVWIVAHDNGGRCQQRDKNERRLSESDPSSASADDALQRLQGERASRNQVPQAHERTEVSLRHSRDRSIWLPEPNVGRVVTGVSGRVHRLRALGNSIVPQVAYQILKAIAVNINQTQTKTETHT